MSLFHPSSRRLLASLAAVLVIAPGVAWPDPAPSPAPHNASPDAQIAALRAEVSRLKGLLPDQSSAMADVGYHFANLWFAAEKKNWPLAGFYLDETRSHLKWAVRIKPIRKSPAGLDVDLKGILDALDNTLFAQLQKTVENQDPLRFAALYRQSLQGCYACHKASGLPFLRPQVPVAPPQPILNFDPNAAWPE